MTGLLAVPIGVAAAIYLEEYGGRSFAARIIEMNITNLAAVPSIIYGLLGLGLFVRALGMGRSVLAGASTLALLVLPVVILSTREALRAVPPSIREGSYALGATKWQTVWYQVLPVALPGILTGTILALSRAIGETAPLITIGALTFVAFAPDGIWSPFTGTAHPDLQLGVPAAERIPGQRSGRDPRPARASADDECCGNMAARPLSEEARMSNSTPPRVPSLAGVAARAVQPAADHPPKIEADRLNFYYAETRALQDISARIQPNVVTAFIGPSGCGKSTFLRTLNRMNDIIPGTRVDGRVLIDGIDVYGPGIDVVALRQRVGMVFQKSNPFPKTIFENVAYGLRINGMAGSRSDLEGRVEQSLQHAALWDEVKDRLHDSALAMSGGQQQRLCIARALAVQPDILLMDEPASALDPIATQRIEELIYSLKNSYTIVIVTHNMQQAARVSDYTAFFWLGRLVEYDRTDKIFTNPGEKLTEDYVTGRFG